MPQSAEAASFEAVSFSDEQPGERRATAAQAGAESRAVERATPDAAVPDTEATTRAMTPPSTGTPDPDAASTAGPEAVAAPAAPAAESAAESAPGSPAGDVATRLSVVGLISVASIAGFKRALGRMPGVSGVSVSSGPTGDFVFTVQHAAGSDLRNVIPELEGFKATITADVDGVLSVTASDPDGNH